MGNSLTNQATHTPGPWKTNVLLVVTERGDQLAHCTRWDGRTPKPEEAQANARLMAAAPESVYRLNVVVPGEPSSVLDAVQAAIANAEGR